MGKSSKLRKTTDTDKNGANSSRNSTGKNIKESHTALGKSGTPSMASLAGRFGSFKTLGMSNSSSSSIGGGGGNSHSKKLSFKRKGSDNGPIGVVEEATLKVGVGVGAVVETGEDSGIVVASRQASHTDQLSTHTVDSTTSRRPVVGIDMTTLSSSLKSSQIRVRRTNSGLDQLSTTTINSVSSRGVVTGIDMATLTSTLKSSQIRARRTSSGLASLDSGLDNDHASTRLSAYEDATLKTGENSSEGSHVSMERNSATSRSFDSLNLTIQGEPGEIWQLDMVEFQEKVGEGSYGSVYRCTEKVSHSIIALKSVSLEDALKSNITSLGREIDILKECKHPNITLYLGSFIEAQKLWIAMEFCGGGSCSEVMQVLGEGFSETEIALIMRESIAGLKHLHKLRKIHRDIKGGNILITETGQVKIADFGVAIPLQNTFAKANTFIGTPYWMAPEVIKGKQYDHTADIWSMGVTAIELAETLPPLASHHPMRVLFSIPNREPAQLKEPGSWSESFAQFIAACLQKEPFKRSSTVELLNHAFITSKNFSPNPLIATITRVKERKLKKQTEEDSGEAFDILQSLVFDDDNAIPGLDTLSCGSVESLGNVSSNSSNLDLIERAIYSESLAATATQSQPNPRSVYKRAQSHEPHTRVAKGDGRGPFARHIQSGRITSGKSMDSVSTPSGNMGRHSGTRSQKGMRTRTHTNESTGSRDSSSSSRLGNLRTASTEFIKTQGGRGSGPSSPISSVYKRSPSSSQGNRMDGLTLRSEDILLSAQRSQKLNGVNTNFQRIRKFERLQESKATTFGIDGGVETVRESPHDRSKWLNECLFRSKETTLTNIATIKCNPVQSTSVRLQNRMPGRVPMSVPTRRRHAPTPRVASSGFMANTMTMAQSGSHLMSQSRTSLV